MAYSRRFFRRFLNQWMMIAALAVAAAMEPPAARAQNAPGKTIIRDAEIETALKTWLAPLIKDAGLSEDAVHIVLVESPQINAFVAGGANIFLYTALIEKTETPGELLGVMAHELGHVAGGHLIATRLAMERASYESILGAIIGIGAGIAGGSGGAAQAIITGSGSMAQRDFLSHSRAQESSADQAGLRFLRDAGFDPTGFRTFLEKLQDQELLPRDQQSQYMRSHPITRERIEAAKRNAETSPYTGLGDPPEWVEAHKRIKAKLIGFISPGQVPWSYDDKDRSVAADYARAIAAYRQNHVNEALKGVDGLLAREPQNPYFHELKGQMLMAFGRVAEAVPPYKKAVSLQPRSGLLRIPYGHALLESGNIQAAVEELEKAKQDEPRATDLYHLLATGYGRMGDETAAQLNLAEEAVLQRRYGEARQLAQAAARQAKPGSRVALRARDIIAYIDANGKD